MGKKKINQGFSTNKVLKTKNQKAKKLSSTFVPLKKDVSDSLKKQKKKKKKEKKNRRIPPGGGKGQEPFLQFDYSGISKKDYQRLLHQEGKVADGTCKRIEEEIRRMTRPKTEHTHSDVRAGWNGVMSEFEKDRTALKERSARNLPDRSDSSKVNDKIAWDIYFGRRKK